MMKTIISLVALSMVSLSSAAINLDALKCEHCKCGTEKGSHSHEHSHDDCTIKTGKNAAKK